MSSNFICFLSLLLSSIFIAWKSPADTIPSPLLQWDLHDLSILLPLPQNEESERELLRLNESQNLELPAEILQALPPFILDDLDEAGTEKSLRLLAVRIDPCFKDSVLDSDDLCRRQIRVILQPLLNKGETYSTTDAALHLFYEFDLSQWTKFLLDWERVKSQGPWKDQLSVHPVLKSEGLQGPKWKNMRKIILQYCELKNLRRVTISTVNRGGFFWSFKGVEVQGGQIQSEIQIPFLQGSTQQVYFTSPQNFEEFKGAFRPTPTWNPLIGKFLKDSLSAMNVQSPNSEDWEGFFKSIRGVDDPSLFNPGDIDCASCHVAPQILNWADGKMSSSNKTRSNRIRMFGYFETEPQVTQRVLKETQGSLIRMTLQPNSRQF